MANIYGSTSNNVVCTGAAYSYLDVSKLANFSGQTNVENLTVTNQAIITNMAIGSVTDASYASGVYSGSFGSAGGMYCTKKFIVGDSIAMANATVPSDCVLDTVKYGYYKGSVATGDDVNNNTLIFKQSSPTTNPSQFIFRPNGNAVTSTEDDAVIITGLTTNAYISSNYSTLNIGCTAVKLNGTAIYLGDISSTSIALGDANSTADCDITIGSTTAGSSVLMRGPTINVGGSNTTGFNIGNSSDAPVETIYIGNSNVSSAATVKCPLTVSGLSTLSAGVTVSGSVNVNNTGSSTTNIATSATAGLVTIGATGGTSGGVTLIGGTNGVTINSKTSGVANMFKVDVSTLEVGQLWNSLGSGASGADTVSPANALVAGVAGDAASGVVVIGSTARNPVLKNAGLIGWNTTVDRLDVIAIDAGSTYVQIGLNCNDNNNGGVTIGKNVAAALSGNATLNLQHPIIKVGSDNSTTVQTVAIGGTFAGSTSTIQGPSISCGGANTTVMNIGNANTTSANNIVIGGAYAPSMTGASIDLLLQGSVQLPLASKLYNLLPASIVRFRGSFTGNGENNSGHIYCHPPMPNFTSGDTDNYTKILFQKVTGDGQYSIGFQTSLNHPLLPTSAVLKVFNVAYNVSSTTGIPETFLHAVVYDGSACVANESVTGGGPGTCSTVNGASYTTQTFYFGIIAVTTGFAFTNLTSTSDANWEITF